MTKEEYLTLAYLLTVRNIAESDIAHLPMLVIVGNTLKGISELGYELVKNGEEKPLYATPEQIEQAIERVVKKHAKIGGMIP